MPDSCAVSTVRVRPFRESPERRGGAELIIACGDLDRRYLEYLATMMPVPQTHRTAGTAYSEISCASV